MRIKFLRDAEYPQIKPDGTPDPERSKSYKAGETYTVDDDHGNRWLRRNAAVEVKDDTHKGKAESLVAGTPAKGHSKSEAL